MWQTESVEERRLEDGGTKSDDSKRGFKFN